MRVPPSPTLVAPSCMLVIPHAWSVESQPIGLTWANLQHSREPIFKMYMQLQSYRQPYQGSKNTHTRTHIRSYRYPNTVFPSQPTPIRSYPTSNIIQILIPTLLPIRIQPLHPDILLMPRAAVQPALRHGPAARLAGLEELAEALLADVEGLRGRRVGHARHGAPQVERVGDVRADGGEDEEDEVDGVA
jgi:hypothetical protein